MSRIRSEKRSDPCLCNVWFKPGRWQSTTLLTVDERESKIAGNSVFDCHLSPIRQQMAFEYSVSNDFYLRSSIELTLSIADPVCGCIDVNVVM